MFFLLAHFLKNIKASHFLQSKLNINPSHFIKNKLMLRDIYVHHIYKYVSVLLEMLGGGGGSPIVECRQVQKVQIKTEKTKRIK